VAKLPKPPHGKRQHDDNQNNRIGAAEGENKRGLGLLGVRHRGRDDAERPQRMESNCRDRPENKDTVFARSDRQPKTALGWLAVDDDVLNHATPAVPWMIMPSAPVGDTTTLWMHTPERQ